MTARRTRLTNRYRETPTGVLRQLRASETHRERVAGIELVLTERNSAYRAAFDATQLVLDAIGGPGASDLHTRALGKSRRDEDAGRYLEAEQARGVADALWDYIRERSDT